MSLVNDYIVGNITEYRKKHGLNQKGMVMRLHISVATLQRYEEGRISVPLEVAERVSELYGKTFAEDPYYLSDDRVEGESK